MAAETQPYLRYWGKARPDAASEVAWHPLPYHAIDVAAVGLALLDGDRRLGAQLSTLSGLSPEAVRRGLFLSLALHDLGKFAPAFQAKVTCASEGQPATPRGPDHGHDLDGLILWRQRLRQQQALLAAFCGDGSRKHHRSIRISSWVEPALCHHGRPRHSNGILLADSFWPVQLDAIDAFVGAVLALAETIGAPAPSPPPERLGANWRLAGLAVLCDWIGSNQHWFPYRAPALKLDEYLALTCEQAARAVREARVLAAVVSMPEAWLHDALAQLVASELLFARGAPPEATYEFKHALVQDAAYASLLKGKRQELHARIITALVAGAPLLADEHPEVLARHYAEAGALEEAVECFERAGRDSLAKSAQAETAANLKKAIELLHRLPVTPERDRRELMLLIPLGYALFGSAGGAADETMAAFSRAKELSVVLGEDNLTRVAYYGLFVGDTIAGKAERARKRGDELRLIAINSRNHESGLIANRMIGNALFLKGELTAAREHLESSLALVSPSGASRCGQGFALDPGVSGVFDSSHALWALGFPDQALERMVQGRSLIDENSDANTSAYSLSLLARFYLYRLEPLAAKATAGNLRSFAEDRGSRFWLVASDAIEGCALTLEGEHERAVECLEIVLRWGDAAGTRQHEPYYRSMLANAYSNCGRHDEALHCINAALRSIRETEQNFYEPNAFVEKAEVLRVNGGRRDMVEVHYRTALQIAERQKARSWQLRAALGLARLLYREGESEEAYSLISPIYSWFSEGFETPDLREAAELLASIGLQRY